MPLRFVAAFSLLFTYAFFFEYLPPFRWVEISYDLQYFQYPLDDFAFQSLRQGRIPEWDPSMYCGITFVGNPQAALFYPPMWLVFLANTGHAMLKYRSLEILVIGHVWLAFLLCFIWLRHKGLGDLACCFGAGVFAYSGYLLLQLSHLGIACGYAWLPCGLWGIDQAVSSRTWRPLWKVAAASSLCFLAGHPPTWFTFCVCLFAYALGTLQWRPIVGTGVAIAYSCWISMVQILPTWEASALKAVHENYGAGIRNPIFYISYLVPNYFDFGMSVPPFTNLTFEYLYLGAPALFGLFWLLRNPKALGRAIPILALGIVSSILLTNPFDLVWTLIQHSSLLSQICRSWNFLAGITVAVAALAAIGIDRFLSRARTPASRWMTPLAVVLLGLWSARQVWAWHPGGPGFSPGWRGAVEPVVMLILFSLAMCAIAAGEGRPRAWMTVGLLLATGVDYKVFGTSKRFNGSPQNADRMFARASFPGLNESVYQELRANTEYRVALDSENPVPMDLRHYGLSTPQGGDPLVPARYHELLPPVGAYYGLLRIDPADTNLLRLLAVRYFLSSKEQPLYSRLKADPNFHAVKPEEGYFTAFEYSMAQPSYRWETEWPGDWIQKTNWSPERREFEVHSVRGGKFVLIEESFPGWEAAIDGRAVPVELWHAVFQSIPVAPGNHRVAFAFKSRGLRIGAPLSALAVLVMGGLLLPRRYRTIPVRPRSELDPDR